MAQVNNGNGARQHIYRPLDKRSSCAHIFGKHSTSDNGCVNIRVVCVYKWGIPFEIHNPQLELQHSRKCLLTRFVDRPFHMERPIHALLHLPLLCRPVATCCSRHRRSDRRRSYVESALLRTSFTQVVVAVCLCVDFAMGDGVIKNGNVRKHNQSIPSTRVHTAEHQTIRAIVGCVCVWGVSMCKNTHNSNTHPHMAHTDTLVQNRDAMAASALPQWKYPFP